MSAGKIEPVPIPLPRYGPSWPADERGACCSEDVAALEDEVLRLREDVTRLAEALRWVLPMAKGYAHEHPVGRNAEMVKHANAVLNCDAALPEVKP